MYGVNGIHGSGRSRRAGLLPYVYGGITGAAVALVVIMAAMVLRDRGDARAIGAGSYRPPIGTLAGVSAGPIGESRRTAIVAATERVAPAVVAVAALHERKVLIWERFWDQFYPRLRPRERTQRSQTFGSGVIVDQRGYIFTNHHVIAGAVRIEVTLRGGTPIQAELVGTSPALKIDGDDFAVAPLGDSDMLLVGEWAIAIGSPFGQFIADNQPTVTVGVISATHRDIRQGANEDQVFTDMIQTDAAINPGNSGGPLVNARGEVIGINTLIFSGIRQASFNIGLGFAIPVNRVNYVFGEILEHGRVREQWVGMGSTDITPEIAVALDLPTRTGVLVQSIVDGGPAAEAGIRPGDQLIAIGGVTLQNTDHANRLIFAHRIGDVVEMTINRKDQLKSFRIRIEARPGPDI
ncbi:MAG: trypsin-like peptidase domain-containing protein [Candidatus Krumholzibacteriota bacterium]|nr:trypsin-like peptidase domain-containing protein [Candidatus Krumholzibacteriota bacterium]